MKLEAPLKRKYNSHLTANMPNTYLNKNTRLLKSLTIIITKEPQQPHDGLRLIHYLTSVDERGEQFQNMTHFAIHSYYQSIWC